MLSSYNRSENTQGVMYSIQMLEQTQMVDEKYFYTK